MSELLEASYRVQVQRADRKTMVALGDKETGEIVAYIYGRDRDEALARAERFAGIESAPTPPVEPAKADEKPEVGAPEESPEADEAPEKPEVPDARIPKVTDAARALAEKAGIDIEAVPHEGDRITQGDVAAYLKSKKGSPTS